MERRPTLPPTRVVIIRRDLVEAELLVVVRADPFGRVDRALLERRVDVAAGDLLRHDAELGERKTAGSADAHLEALQVATLLIGFLNQPPIWQPVLPAGNWMMLYSLKNSRISSRPPP